MKKSIGRFLALALCAALLGVPVSAAGEEGPSRMGPVQVWGTVTHLEDGSLLIENGGEKGLDSVIVRLGGAPVVDAVTGAPMDAVDLKDGDTVYAWVGPAMTMSLPPQTSAVLVVGNIPADYAVPQYYEVAEVKPQAVIAIYPAPPLTKVELVAVGGKELTVTDGAAISPYLTKNVAGLADLVPGARMLVWTDDAGTVTKVLVFPYAYRGYIEWTDAGMLAVDGRNLSAMARAVDGETYLPVRAVAEAVGCEVRWQAGKGAVVSTGGAELFSVLPGASAALTADGETPFLGSCVIDQGVTYLPAYILCRLLNLFWNY